MEKLYLPASAPKNYWEYWGNEDQSFTVHWGQLGTTGEDIVVRGSLLNSARKKIDKLKAEKIAEGFRAVELDQHHRLVVEYLIVGHGTIEDLEKRHRLEDQLNNTLGWTGLGHCDGGDIGSGAMAVYSFVVDFDLAKKVVTKELERTEFSDYSRIFGASDL